MENEITLSLLEQLSEEHRALVEQGVYSAHPGKTYPMLRWAAGPRFGQLAPGTGVAPNAIDAPTMSRASAHKRTSAYRELLEKYLPADLDDKKRGSLGWILSQGLTALEGGDVVRAVQCPECNHEFSATMWKKPDTNALKVLMEALIGRPDVTKDLNINSEHIYRMIDERRDARDLIVYDVSPTERAEREVVDAEWRELSGS